MFIVLPRLRMRISVFALPVMLMMLWCEGVVPFFILVFSAVVHEFGHLFAIYRLGYRIRRIDILPMGALIVVPEGIPDADEYNIAISGPLASLVLAALSCLWFVFSGTLPAFFSTFVNLTLALFNLMPIQKLDGGKALYSYLASKQIKTEPVCSALSIVSKLFFLILTAVFIAGTDFNLGVILLSAVLLIQLFEKS